MRLFVTAAIALLFIFSSLFAADLPKSKSASLCLESIAADFDNGTLVITPLYGEDFKVEITEDNELYINGRKVSTGAEERQLLAEYRNDMIYMVDRATEIGLKGAGIGLHAIGGLIAVACTEAEMEDLEAELEAESEKIEMEAEELEELSSRLEELHSELKYRISDLRELRSF